MVKYVWNELSYSLSMLVCGCLYVHVHHIRTVADFTLLPVVFSCNFIVDLLDLCVCHMIFTHQGFVNSVVKTGQQIDLVIVGNAGRN